jgi:hypothetical protein
MVAVLWVVLIPVRAGATEQLPAFSYLAMRVRYLFARPEMPGALSGWMRHVWSLDHAPLAPHIAIALVVPLGLLAAAAFLHGELRTRRAFRASAVVFVVATMSALIDRSVLAVATMALIVFCAGAVHSLHRSMRLRMPLVVAALAIVLGAMVFRDSRLDLPYQVSRVAGVAHRDPHAFVWLSFENTDRELVRFVVSRTSVRETILAPDDVSALLMAFTGRKTAALPGAVSRAASERHVALTQAMYESEEELFDLCRAARIDYVVYSIDVVMDTGRYSPRYLAAAGTVSPASIGYRMHFEPESLRRFTLVYENDHYRVFDVTATPEPIFATDHPLFYSTDLLVKADRDIDAFRKLAIDVMLTYSDARLALARGDAAGAVPRLEWCLLQAPRYSAARIALADALVDLNRLPEARRVIGKLIEYAPDHTEALYYAAFFSAQAGDSAEAKNYLSLLFSIERDPAALERARTLQTAIEQGIPLRVPSAR